MDNNEVVSVGTAPENGQPKSNRLGFVTGLIIVIFAAIGVISLVVVGITNIKEAAAEKKAAEYAAYNSFLIPAAAIDITPFDDITSADMSELVEMSVWSIIGSNLDPSEFDYSSGKLAVPEDRVSEAYERFFGTQVPIQHRTVEGYGYEFTYNSTDKMYYIPLTAITPIYTPDVTAVETKGNAVTLTCGYINANMWVQNQQTGALVTPAPDKYMKITLRRDGGSSYISAIRSSSVPETASTAASAQNTASPQTTVPLESGEADTSAESTYEETTAS